MADNNGTIAPQPLAEATTGFVNPFDKASPIKSGDPDFVKNLVSADLQKEQAILLDEAPELDTSLLDEVPPQKSVLLLILRIVFTVFLIAGIASFLFFTSQLSSTFGFLTSKFKIPNVSEQLALSNEEIISFQTDLNFNRYLMINGLFDQFAKDSDSYLQNYEVKNSQTSSSEEQKEAESEMNDLKSSMKDHFTKLQKLFSGSFASTIIDEKYAKQEDLDRLYQEKLLAKIDEKVVELSKETDPQAKRDLRSYVQTKNLVSNFEIKNLVKSTDFSALDEKQIYEFVKNLNSLIVNDLSVIRKIKDERVKWSDIINEIDLRTKAVDKNFSEDYYNELGGIRYTNYDFERDTKEVSIIGETKQFGTENFTLIVDLIDELNSSKLFNNAAMRSFNKSGTIEEGYVAFLRLAFNLQDGESSPQDKDLDISKKPEILEN